MYKNTPPQRSPWAVLKLPVVYSNFPFKCQNNIHSLWLSWFERKGQCQDDVHPIKKLERTSRVMGNLSLAASMGSSFVFIGTFYPGMTSADKKIIHHFFPRMTLLSIDKMILSMDEIFSSMDEILSPMDGIFICHVLGWKLEKKV